MCIVFRRLCYCTLISAAALALPGLNYPIIPYALLNTPVWSVKSRHGQCSKSQLLYRCHFRNVVSQTIRAPVVVQSKSQDQTRL